MAGKEGHSFKTLNESGQDGRIGLLVGLAALVVMDSDSYG